MTFGEAVLLMRGYNDRLIGQYKQTRLLMFMMAKMLGDPKKTPATPEQLWPLPGDTQAGQMSENEIAAMFEKLK